MPRHSPLRISDEHVFCLYCRNALIKTNEKNKGYHESCNNDIVQYKDKLGEWYYLGMVQAGIDDCTFDYDGNIIGLNLSNKGLFTLPELPFKRLQELDLSYNHLDRVSEWVFNLPDLKKVSFPGNGFSRTLLLDMLRLNQKGLTVISTGCKFDNNKHLIRLNFAYLGGRSPFELSEEITAFFTHVESVNLTWNSLEYVPEWVYSLTHLKEIDLAENRLKSISERLLELPHLKRINLSQNFFTIEIENDIRNLEQHGIAVTFSEYDRYTRFFNNM